MVEHEAGPSVITSITGQKRNKERVNIFIDGEYALSLSRAIAIDLQIGQTIDEAAISKLTSADAVEEAKQKAFRFLSYRPRSTSELRQYLNKKGYEEPTIESVIRRLNELEMLNDRQFARYWVEQRETFKPRSRLAVRTELMKLGLDREVIDQAVAGIDEPSAAYRAGKKKLNSWSGLSPDEFITKMIPYLQRRGFNYAIAKTVSEALWNELPDGNS